MPNNLDFYQLVIAQLVSQVTHFGAKTALCVCPMDVCLAWIRSSAMNVNLLNQSERAHFANVLTVFMTMV
jgi:hypothetical protein